MEFSIGVEVSLHLKIDYFFFPPFFGEVLLSGLESQEKEVFPRKKEKSPF